MLQRESDRSNGRVDLPWNSQKARDWRNYVPPARPSESELTLLEALIKSKVSAVSRPRALILGCTVEYRSLAHKWGLEVTLVEGARIHYEILSRQHMTFSGKENVVICDWRNFAEEAAYDIALGDHALNLVSGDDLDLVLRNVAKALRPNGVFLPRSYVSYPGMPRNWPEILHVVSTNFPRVNFFTATAAFAYVAYTNPATGFTDIARLMTELRAHRRRIGDRKFAMWADRMSNEKSGICILRRAQFERKLSAVFRIAEVKQGIDVFARYLKIHVLRSR